MAELVGVNVLEVEGKTLPAIQAAATSVAAFVGRTERGVPDRPVQLLDPGRFQQRFGGFRADAFLPYAVDGFFANEGREAHVVRVVGAGSLPSTATLDDRQGAAAASLRISAGYRGQADPGSWGDRIRIDVRDDLRSQTAVSGPLPGIGASDVVLNSTDGIAVGTVLRMDAGGTIYRRVTGVSGNTATFSPPLTVALTTAAVETSEFRITVHYRATPSDDFEVVETWSNLSMESTSDDYVVNRVNHDILGSRYISVVDLTGGTPVGENNPAIVSSVPLAGGVEVAATLAEILGTAADRTGLHALDQSDVQLVAVPDAHQLAVAADVQAVVAGAIGYCASRGDCMFVGSAPDRGAGVLIPRSKADYTQTVADYLASVRAYADQFRENKSYGALYGPWIRVVDPVAPSAGFRFVPADGHVIGMFGRIDQARGIHAPPAGIRAMLRGAMEPSADFTDREHDNMVRAGHVNGIRLSPGAGVVVTTSRMLSSDTRWWYVNARLLFNFVKSSLRRGLRFVRQRPHSGELRNSVRLTVVRPFLMGLYRQGAFGKGQDPTDVFTIKCDAENNPPDQVDQGFFHIEVYFYPVRPAETVIIKVGQQPSGGFASEA